MNTVNFVFVLLCLVSVKKSFIGCNMTSNLIDSSRDQNSENSAPQSNIAASVATDASTVELITRNGYPVETHDIITKDNYILTTHRIPFGRNSIGKVSTKPPVFVLHGNAQSSADFVLNSRIDNCLGFVLADSGFDVWLGNARGNVYSNKHVTLSNRNPSYWNFSMDESGMYDIPATIDYILEITHKPKLHFIGFSLGNTRFYAALARYPALNTKIALHISYGPSVFFGNFPNPTRTFSHYWRVVQRFHDLIGGLPVPPNRIYVLLTRILPIICNPNVDLVGLCHLVMFSVMGSENQISREQMPRILGHVGTSTPLKMIIHVLQWMDNGNFTYYDYGPYKNKRMYGQPDAPHYKLEHVTAPVALFRGGNDRFANLDAVDRLAEKLINVVEYYVVPYREFTHLDFCYARNANVLVYNHSVNLLNKFSH